MKRFIKSSTTTLSKYAELPSIEVAMYIFPEIYSGFSNLTASNTLEQVASAVTFDKFRRQYHTDVNPERVINKPLSDYGQQLEAPIQEEFDSFKKDCRWLINELGFTIIHQETSTDSKKSEYLIVFGLNDEPCGTLVYDLRISDHPFNATFPEELKDKALEYLKMNKILDNTATKAGIDFSVEKITVGIHETDSWDKAFNRLYLLLKKLRNTIRIRNNERRKK